MEDDPFTVCKNYNEFLFRKVKKAGPKLTREDLEAHQKEQEEYDKKTYHCKKCKKDYNPKGAGDHFHKKLDRYDYDYLYGTDI